MMIETRADGDDQVLVTFRLPAVVGATKAAVVGEFNGWSADAHPMEADGDGHAITIALAPGRTYRFRYLVDGERWENDWAAHGYMPNEFGGDDGVVDLTNGHATRRADHWRDPS